MDEIKVGLSSDIMFKLIFGREENKEFTAWLFNIIQDKIKINAEDIIFMNSKKQRELKEFVPEMDIVFRVENKVYVDVEIQMYNPVDYDLIERLDTYASSLKLDSLKKGDNYRKRKTFVICFCKNNIIDSDECIIVKKEMMGNKEILKNHNLIVIQLSNYKNCSNIMVRSVLELMLTKNLSIFKGRDETMDSIIEMMFKYNEDPDLRYCMMKKEIDEIFDFQEKENALEEKYNKGVQAGIEQGIEKGVEKGIEKGVDKNRKEIIKRMIKMNKTEEDISLILGISCEDVRKNIKEMN